MDSSLSIRDLPDRGSAAEAVAGAVLALPLMAAYSLDMDNSAKSGPGVTGKNDTGEVPEKQLHRWKGEGGALPPEPDTDSESEHDPEAGSGSESRPETDDA
jgi:hypothetical protein